MIKTTRQQIIDLLSSKGIATATEISTILHITHSNARHHLNNLESEGLIHATGILRNLKRGRPARQFQLARSLEEHNLDRLSSALLKNMRTSIPKSTWVKFLESVAKDLSTMASENLEADHLSHRLNLCTLQLNKQHYRSRWEAHTKGPRIILGHCPYKQIILNHPELCRMDARIIELLVGRSVDQIAKLDQTSQGLEICIFTINKKKDSLSPIN